MRKAPQALRLGVAMVDRSHDPQPAIFRQIRLPRRKAARPDARFRRRPDHLERPGTLIRYLKDDYAEARRRPSAHIEQGSSSTGWPMRTAHSDCCSWRDVSSRAETARGRALRFAFARRSRWLGCAHLASQSRSSQVSSEKTANPAGFLLEIRGERLVRLALPCALVQGD